MWSHCESSQMRAKGKLGLISALFSFQVLLNLAKFYKHFRGRLEFCILLLDLSYDPEKSRKRTDVFEMDFKPPFKTSQ